NVGDVLFATGSFGNSFHSEHHLDFVPRIKEGQWLSRFGVTAMMDVTDGLLQDAAKVAKASNCSLVIDEKLVNLRLGADLKMAFTDGEDYELIFAVNSEKASGLVNKWPFDTELTEIGFFKEQSLGSCIINNTGVNLIEKYGAGFDHFDEK
ncbi:MAG: AIR synthase-related protein, partial [Lentisphaeraceae bacterium]|nr:AIR synthase-related protein [Lentisphaeraceae bacterium]